MICFQNKGCIAELKNEGIYQNSPSVEEYEKVLKSSKCRIGFVVYLNSLQ